MTNDTVLLNALLPASPERLFRALTDVSDLVFWYSQQAELEPVVGGVGRFEGKDGHFLESWTVEALTPPHSLVVMWTSQADPMADVRLRVAFALTDEAHQTRCQIRAQALSGSPGGIQSALAEWALAVDHLQTWLEDEEERAFAVNSAALAVELAAPRERVWQALTEPEQLRQWFWIDADMQAGVPGSPFLLRGMGQSRADSGRLVRARPAEVLVLDWYDGLSPRRVYWRLSGDTRWSIQDGPFDGTDAWRQPLCEVGWRSAQAALQAWLASDGTPHLQMDLVCETALPTTVADAWAALTEPERQMLWMAESADAAGLRANESTAACIHAEPHKRLIMLWSSGEVQTVASLSLASRDDEVVLRVHHWGFVGHEALRQGFGAFWTQAAERLRELVGRLQPSLAVNVPEPSSPLQ